MTIQPTNEFGPALGSGGVEAIHGIDPAAAGDAQSRSDNPMIGLRDGLRFVRRRFRLIGAITLLGAVLSAVAAFNLPKSYTAASAIVLERNDTRPFQAVDREERDRSATETEMDIITSRYIGGKVVDALGLTRYPDFNGSAKSGTQQFLDSISAALPRLPTGLRAQQPDPESQPAADTGSPPGLALRDFAISTLMLITKVTRTGDSLAIDIAVSLGDPELAATLANAIAKEYVAASVEQKREPNLGAEVLLRTRDQTLLTRLRDEEAALVRDRASNAARFGPNHPKIMDADAAIASARALIRLETERISAERKLDAQQPGARVISLAEVPLSPSFPKPKLIIAGGIVGSVVLAIFLAVMLEGADTKIRAGGRSTLASGLPNLAYVPRIPRRLFRRRRSVFQYMLKRPQSAFAEAMRSIYLQCCLVGRRQKQVVLITSCYPREGKTTVAVGLAITAAADGRRTALVDLDLRRRGMKDVIPTKKDGYSLQQLFLGECSLADVVHHHPDTPLLDTISAVSRQDHKMTWTSHQLREVLLPLSNEYEVIVLDTPPVLVVNDANWLSSLVDLVVLVTQWGKTEENDLRDAVRKLRVSSAPLIGYVINQVDLKAQARHADDESSKYHRRSKGYTIN